MFSLGGPDVDLASPTQNLVITGADWRSKTRDSPEYSLPLFLIIHRGLLSFAPEELRLNLIRRIPMPTNPKDLNELVTVFNEKITHQPPITNRIALHTTTR
jgi:hypothetical protein